MPRAITIVQGRSQTSEQDEASFERRRHAPENFEIYKLRNVLLSIYRGIFLQKKSILGKCRSSLFLLLSDTSAKLMPSAF